MFDSLFVSPAMAGDDAKIAMLVQILMAILWTRSLAVILFSLKSADICKSPDLAMGASFSLFAFQSL